MIYVYNGTGLRPISQFVGPLRQARKLYYTSSNGIYKLTSWNHLAGLIAYFDSLNRRHTD